MRRPRHLRPRPPAAPEDAGADVRDFAPVAALPRALWPQDGIGLVRVEAAGQTAVEPGAAGGGGVVAGRAHERAAEVLGLEGAQHPG